MISIVVASRNRPKHLTNLFNSLIKTNSIPDEVILVDNDSDQMHCYPEIVEKFKEKLPVKYYIEKKLGPNHARNYGVEVATGEIIVFVDDDCEVQAGWLANLVAPIINDENIGAVGGKIIPKYNKSFLDLFYHLINFYIQ